MWAESSAEGVVGVVVGVVGAVVEGGGGVVVVSSAIVGWWGLSVGVWLLTWMASQSSGVALANHASTRTCEEALQVTSQAREA